MKTILELYDKVQLLNIIEIENEDLIKDDIAETPFGKVKVFQIISPLNPTKNSIKRIKCELVL